MFSTYLKTEFRNLLRQKSFGLINVAGLSIGIACALILGLYLHNELSYDRHHENHERVYRLINEFNINGDTDYTAGSSTQVGRMMAEQFDEIVGYARLLPIRTPRYLLRSGDIAYYWEDIYLANNGVFQLFTHNIIYGDPETALIEPDSMAVSASLARRYFGNADPVGEIIEVDNNDFRIDLVFEDLPGNSHLIYDVLLSYESIGDPDPTQALRQLWSIGGYNYMMFKDDYNVANFKQLSEQFFEENMEPMARRLNLDATVNFLLEPLARIHLRSSTTFDLPRGNIFYVYAFAAIAVFVMLVACINYMNLTTARSTKRAKEVGMRKVLGAFRAQLVVRFLGESFFYVLVSLLLALLISYFLVNFTGLSQLLGPELSFDVLLSSRGVMIMVSGSLLIGVISGLYPAFYLSSIVPMSAFKGVGRIGRSGSKTREVLVLLQFVISVAVIASTFFMLAQMNYVRAMPLGFDKENKIVVRVQGADQVERIPSLKNELLQLNGVKGVAIADRMPGDRVAPQSLRVEDNNGVYMEQTINRTNVGFGYIDALGIDILEGRDFDETRETDHGGAILVNRAMVAARGWGDPIGKRVSIIAPDADPWLIIGVLEDFHYAGLQEEVEPIILTIFQPNLQEMSAEQRRAFSTQLLISVTGDGLIPTIDFLQQRWAAFDAEHPFEFRLLENSLNELYGSEQHSMQMIGMFAVVCILISCLGLYGLSAFNTAQRSKEIGIRKVLGASSFSIILLLFRKVMLLIVIASLIASVISFWAISEWLGNFFYRIDMLGVNLMIFPLTTILAVIIAFGTMALQSLKIAQSNPVKALRYE